MRARCLAPGLLLAIAGQIAFAGQIRSAAPAAIAVTVYRAGVGHPGGSISLETLDGFALVSEQRRVTLPAGESTLTFEGVAGGIEASSAILSGLPEDVIEKNRDAHLLSPSALLAAALGREVLLERSNPKTGKAERVNGTLLSDAEGGVLFKTAAGVEALRCSGLPETFGFEPFAGAAAVPTLSVRVRSSAPVTRTVTLSYLARGFDWAATYTATLAADGRSMHLGAWVTLANGNGESFPDARAQLIAGRLNREANDQSAADPGGPIIAQCWPRGSTSDSPPVVQYALPSEADAAAPAQLMMRALAAPVAMMKVQQEQLGDLKLYRVPEPTTVAARQMKQVRLMDQSGVPVTQFYRVQIVSMPGSDDADTVSPAMRRLRTRNTAANQLGLPLPSGSIAVFAPAHGATLLLSQDEMRDHAVDEDLEIGLGESSDVRVESSTEQRGFEGATLVPLRPGVSLRTGRLLAQRRVEISNARDREAQVELVLQLDADLQLVAADRASHLQSGRPVFTLTVPPEGRLVLRYALARSDGRLVRPQ